MPPGVVARERIHGNRLFGRVEKKHEIDFHLEGKRNSWNVAQLPGRNRVRREKAAAERVSRPTFLLKPSMSEENPDDEENVCSAWTHTWKYQPLLNSTAELIKTQRASRGLIY